MTPWLVILILPLLPFGICLFYYKSFFFLKPKVHKLILDTLEIENHTYDYIAALIIGDIWNNGLLFCSIIPYSKYSSIIVLHSNWLSCFIGLVIMSYERVLI